MRIISKFKKRKIDLTFNNSHIRLDPKNIMKLKRNFFVVQDKKLAEFGYVNIVSKPFENRNFWPKKLLGFNFRQDQ